MDVIALLEELVRTDSANPFRCEAPDPGAPSSWRFYGNEKEVSAILERELLASGFSVTRQVAHTDPCGVPHHNLLAEKGEGPRSLLFYAHMDTVTTRPWPSRSEALTPRREIREFAGGPREILSGLGAFDMKAGAAVLATAFRDFLPRGFRLKVAFGVDEEYFSLGGNALARSPFMEDVAAVVVPEIGDGPNRCMGPSTITLGRLGRCEFVVDVPGTGGHGTQAFREGLVNAAGECARVVARLEAYRSEYRDAFTFSSQPVPDPEATGEILGTLFVSRVEAGDGSVSIPSSGQIRVSLTRTPLVSLEQAQAVVQNVVDGLYEDGTLREIDLGGVRRRAAVSLYRRPTPHCDAYLTPEDHPFTLLVREAVEATVGFSNYTMGYSLADENVFCMARPGLPVLGIPPAGDFPHKAGEWVDVESVRDMVRVYREIAERFSSFPLHEPGR